MTTQNNNTTATTNEDLRNDYYNQIEALETQLSNVTDENGMPMEYSNVAEQIDALETLIANTWSN